MLGLVNKNLSPVDFLKDWYDNFVIKASLCDITSVEAYSNKSNAIIAVQSEPGVVCRFDNQCESRFYQGWND